MRVVFCAALAASLIACAARPPGQPAMADGTVAAAAAADDGERLICRDEDAPTGSHLRRTQRVCATEEEWQRRRELNQRAVEGLRQRAGQSNPGGN